MANCETCKSKNAPENVPYIVHESAMARMERQIKRLWIALIVCIALIFACNAAWLVYEIQYETLDYSYDYDYQQDGQGTNIIGNGNEVIADGATTPSED